MAIELYPHQEAALEKMHNGCILYGGTGTGKSITSVGYYQKHERPRDVYVITTAKKRDSLDWVGEFAGIGVGTERDATVAGLLTVDSWNNIGKYAGVTDAFFIFDEQRLVGSGHWTKSFIKIARANRWILLSATPGDTWLDYIPVFCANGYYKNRTEFKREHCVYSTYTRFPKVERYIGVPRLVRQKNAVLVEMTYLPHTVRHSTDVKVMYDKELFDLVVKKRWHVYESRPLRDVAELFSVMRKVVNSDASRLRKLQELMQSHPRLIVFYNFDYELHSLRTLAHMSGAQLVENDLSKQESTPHQYEANESTILSIAESSDGKTLPASSRSGESTQSRTSRSSSVKNDKKISKNSTSEKYDLSILSQQKSETGTKTREAESSNTDTTQAKLNGDGSRQTPPLPESFQVAEWNGHKHQPIPETDRWVYLVQYSAGSEGWNCTDTDAMVFYSLTYSYKLFHQAHGRIDRLNTPFNDLYYYILKSNSPVDRAVWGSLKQKKSFNERKYVDIFT